MSSKKLFVGNLSFQTSSGDLEQFFTEVGKVESVTVVTDSYTGRSRGFGFVEMSTQEEAEKAIAELNGRELDGRALAVNIARPREDRGGGASRTPRRGGDRNKRW